MQRPLNDTFATYEGYITIPYNETVANFGGMARTGKIIVPVALSFKTLYTSEFTIGAVQVNSKYVRQRSILLNSDVTPPSMSYLCVVFISLSSQTFFFLTKRLKATMVSVLTTVVFYMVHTLVLLD